MDGKLFIVLFVFLATVTALKQNGMVYAGWGTGAYANAASDQSLQELVESKAQWASIVITWYQPTINDTTIGPTTNSVNDTDISHWCRTATSLGLKIVFKPHVDLSNDATHWRGQIGQNFDDDQWQAWFASYQQYLAVMANYAVQFGADMFIVGTELVATDSQDAYWRATIAGVRAIYKGSLIYGANWYPFTDVTWWDALDYIGCDAYWPLASSPNPPLSELITAWSTPLQTIELIATKFNKSVIFTEIGYVSTTEAAMYGSGGALSTQAQANAYEAFFQAVYPLPWVAGVYWWAWSNDPQNGGRCDPGFSPHNKTAELVLQKYYSNNEKDDDNEFGPAITSVYMNGVFGSGWQDWSYGGSVNWQNTTKPQSGEQYAAFATLDSYGAVSIHYNGFPLSGFSALTFDVFGVEGFADFLNVALSDMYNELYSLPIANYLANCTVSTAWQSVQLPLSALEATNIVISRINIINTGSSTAEFYLDQISFV